MAPGANVVLLLLVAVCALTLSRSRAAQRMEGDAIQRQLDALGEGGGTVRLKAGTYLIRNTLRLDDHVTLQGAGMDKTVLRLAPGVNAPALMTRNWEENNTPQGNHDITLRDLTVDGNGAENAGLVFGAICLPNCYNYRIERVRVARSRGFAGIYTNPNHAAAREKIPYGNFIVDCVVEGTLPKHFGPDDPDPNPYGHGIYITAWDNENVLLRGNVARNNHGAGIHLEDFVQFVFVEQNECYGNGGCGIWACEAARSVFRFNRVHHNGASGLDLVQGKGNFDNLVLGNDIHHNGGPGITASRHYDPGDSRIVMVGNRLWDNDEAGILVRETARANVIGFNYCWDDQEKPIQSLGIVVESADNQVIHNCVGGAEKAIRLAGGNTLQAWPTVPWTPQNLVADYYPSAPWREPGPVPAWQPEPHPQDQPADGPGDEAAIQRQVDALGPEGGVVRLEPHTYLFRGPVLLRDNVTIQGAGRDRTVIRMADDLPKGEFRNVAFKSTNFDENKAPQGNGGIAIRDLTIDGNARNNPWTGEGIYLPNAYGYRIEHVRVVDCRGFAGIYTSPCHAARARQVAYQDFVINCIVEGNRPAHDRDAPYGHGIYITARDNENVLLRGNLCRHNAGSGIHLEDGVKFIFVIGNECTDNRQYGLWLCGVSASAVVGNRLRGNLRGMMVNYAGTDVLIADNEVETNRLEGMYFGTPGFDRPGTSYQAPEPSRCVVVGNLVRNNNQAYQDAGAGVYCEWRGNLFAHNAIYDDQEDPTQFIGLWLAAPDNVAVNNYLTPQAYRGSTGYFTSVTGGNTFVPFDYEKPWTPRNLVGRY